MFNPLILGNGVVGSAYAKRLGIKAVDPRSASRDFIESHNAYIICVPTPMNEWGRCDISAVEDILLKYSGYGKSILIKSTVAIDKLADLDKAYPNIAYSPEFLSEATAEEDVKNETTMIIGGRNAEIRTWVNFFLKHRYRFQVMTLKEAAYVKYAENAYLATKVTFFNELFNLIESEGGDVDYKNVLRGLSVDPRIGTSHTQVPGPDDKFGWGGKCLPKDVSEFLNFSMDQDSKLRLLDSVLMLNDKHRERKL